MLIFADSVESPRLRGQVENYSVFRFVHWVLEDLVVGVKPNDFVAAGAPWDGCVSDLRTNMRGGGERLGSIIGGGVHSGLTDGETPEKQAQQAHMLWGRPAPLSDWVCVRFVLLY